MADLNTLLKNSYGLTEGTDGSGKDTILKKIIENLEDVIVTREPGGTPEAEAIRSVILEKDWDDRRRASEINLLLKGKVINVKTRDLLVTALSIIEKEGINGKSEAFLYAASRSESIEKVVIPALESGKAVFGGRSVASSVAYQGSARGLGMENIWKLNEPIVKTCLPSFELYFDVPVEIAQQRLAGRTEKQDRLDGESISFFEKVRDGYLYYYKNICPYPYIIIDASKSVEEVYQQAIDAIEKLRK